MCALPNELYKRCRNILLKCGEFDSDAALRAMFVTQELAPFRNGLSGADSASGRVDACLAFLVYKRLSDGRAVLPLFLAALRDRYPEGDGLRDELSTLVEVVESAFNLPRPPSTKRQTDSIEPTQQTNRQAQRIDTIASDTQAPPYIAHIEDDIEQFINRIARCLVKKGNHASQQPLDVSHLWFVHHQEIWETSFFILSQLRDDLTTALASDLETVMEASVSFQQLSIQASEILEILKVIDEGLPPGKPRSYLQNDLRRIIELASATSNQLEVLADRISWGLSLKQPVQQVERNLVPLGQLVQDTLEWLNHIVEWFDGIEAALT